jgi:hypothetical protein
MAELIEQDARVKTELDASLGYAVANMKVIKVPIVVKACSLINRQTNVLISPLVGLVSAEAIGGCL